MRVSRGDALGIGKRRECRLFIKQMEHFFPSIPKDLMID